MASKPDTTEAMLKRLAEMEAVLRLPALPEHPLPVQFPFFVSRAREVEGRTQQLLRQIDDIRAHAGRAGRHANDDPRLMQTAKGVRDARRDRDGWIQRADDMLTAWQNALPTPEPALQDTPALARRPRRTK